MTLLNKTRVAFLLLICTGICIVPALTGCLKKFEPECPPNLSSEAIFVGNIEHGRWYVFEQELPNLNKYEIKIYSYHGSLSTHSIFRLEDGCIYLEPSLEKIKDNVTYFDGSSIFFKYNDSINCRLLKDSIIEQSY